MNALRTVVHLAAQTTYFVAQRLERFALRADQRNQMVDDVENVAQSIASAHARLDRLDRLKASFPVLHEDTL